MSTSSPCGRRCPAGTRPGRRRRPRRCRGRTTAGGGPSVEAGPEARYGFLLDDDGPRFPTRARRASPTACTAVPPLRHPTRTPGLTAPGPAGPRRRRRLRAARRHLHPRGHLRRGDRAARPPGRARRRLRRTAAGQRVQRHAQLGLRRRRSGTPCTSPTAGPTAISASSTPATARPRRDPGRRLQPPRPVGNYLPIRAYFAAAPTPGAVDQPRRGRTPTRCAATSSTTP